jgi:hypothetical protein
MTRLDEIDARLAAATPGPWQEFCESGDWWVEQSDGEYTGTGRIVGGSPLGWAQADLDLAISAPADLAALLRVARAAHRIASNPDAVAWAILERALMALNEPQP